MVLTCSSFYPSTELPLVLPISLRRVACSSKLTADGMPDEPVTASLETISYEALEMAVKWDEQGSLTHVASMVFFISERRAPSLVYQTR